MKRLHSGRRRRCFVFRRVELSESLSSPSSWRNHTSVSCGMPSRPTVARVANWASSRSRCDSGKSVMSPLSAAARAQRGGHAHECFDEAYMTLQRMDNVLIVVEDLEAAKAFFAELGMELEGETTVEGPFVDSTVGLKDVRADIAMMRTPDGHGRVELSRFHTPPAVRAG